MPVRNFATLGDAERQQAADYVPGYDWVPGRFGPPPGILKARKDEFDRMSDNEYFYAFQKLSQEEKESLMVAEAERRRTFVAHWPIESIVKAHDCAKEGFYYTGVADRVQCAFCGGIVRNWERGDVPKFQHKNFFNYCKMVQNKPCPNIPIGNCSDLKTDRIVLPTGADGKAPTLLDLRVNTVMPKTPAMSTFANRRATYRRYPESNPVDADKLCDAGFLYEGLGDKVKCFWCDGALEMWSRGDEPWVEHSKWYPGCTYVQQMKGANFIKRARKEMTATNIATAETLQYNKGDVSFLDDETIVEEVVPIEQLAGYKYCISLNYNKELVERAYAANLDEEFEDLTLLVGIVQELDEGTTTLLDEHIARMQARSAAKVASGGAVSTIQPGRRINVQNLITNPDDPTDQECSNLVDAIRCKLCRANMAGAVVLPCGCFCLCQECSKGNLPQKCPACGNTVRGACRTYLS